MFGSTGFNCYCLPKCPLLDKMDFIVLNRRHPALTNFNPNLFQQKHVRINQLPAACRASDGTNLKVVKAAWRATYIFHQTLVGMWSDPSICHPSSSSNPGSAIRLSRVLIPRCSPATGDTEYQVKGGTLMRCPNGAGALHPARSAI